MMFSDKLIRMLICFCTKRATHRKFHFFVLIGNKLFMINPILNARYYAQ